ncbi:MAG: nucleotidyltransferase domain-containing protein [Clostridia bacterium]|nr:nucleotidyltransferase domain-containing protein [Clostridia bacterium]
MEDKLKNLPSAYRNDIEKAVTILKEYGATEVYVFGSIVNGKFNENSDIDIAVRGLKSSEFYKVASILMFELENEIDLIDLDDTNNSFSQMLLKIGGLLQIG